MKGQAPVALAANLRDLHVNVLARQIKAGDVSCDAVGNTGAEG